MKRLRQLDALRGLAAVVVVLFHYTWWYRSDVAPHTPGLIATLPYGQHGVDLFFVISGFVILMTLERSRGLVDFAISRFARLYPAYAACSVITLGLIVVGHFNPNFITPTKALVSMLMLSPLAHWPAIDLSYWTLTYEVLFYVAAGTVFLGFGVRRVEWPCIVWLAVALAGRVAGLAARSHRTDVLLDFEFANLFVAGMMIFRIVSGRATRLSYATPAFAFAVTAAPSEWSTLFLPRAAYFALVCCCCAAVFAAAKGWLAVLEWRPILFLGDVSYTLYLIHQLVGFWVIRRLELAGTDPNLAIGAACMVALGLAASVRAAIERPAQAAIRRAYASCASRRGVAIAAAAK